MNNQGEDPFVKRDAGGLRFLAGPFKRDYNIAYHFTREIRVIRSPAFRRSSPGRGEIVMRGALNVGKRYDVGRLVPSEEFPVEFPYPAVIDKEDTYISIR